MIDDLPAPEIIPANTKLKTERIQIDFDDAGTATISVVTVKGYTDAQGFHADAGTRQTSTADGLDISQGMAPKAIMKAIADQVAQRRAERRAIQDQAAAAQTSEPLTLEITHKEKLNA